MSEFNGFPARMEYTPVPNLFLNSVLPQITDAAEIKVTLHIFRILYFKKGAARFVTFEELESDVSLILSLEEICKQPDTILRVALDSAVKRKTLIQVTLEDGNKESIFLLNTESNKIIAEQIRSGELKLSGLEAKHSVPELIIEKPTNIFTLYEENVGLLTPMIAEELRDAEKTYPEAWLKDAIKEAVNAGKRNWRYISAILERWETEGKSDGTHLRDFKKADPDKYIKGKYGHTVKR